MTECSARKTNFPVKTVNCFARETFFLKSETPGGGKTGQAKNHPPQKNLATKTRRHKDIFYYFLPSCLRVLVANFMAVN